MIIRALFLAAMIAALAVPAFAQEQTEFLGKAVAALQRQRNACMDDAVNLQARTALLADSVARKDEEIAKLQQRVVELEKASLPTEGPK